MGACTSTWLANWRTYFTHCQLRAKCWAKVDAWRLLSFTGRSAAYHLHVCVWHCGWCALAAHLVCPAVPRGMIYTCELRAPCPSARAAKRIMAMNKSAVAIDHPVILSDMQSANVTPLFINRALARIQDIREWEGARAAGVEIGWFTRVESVSALAWLVGTPDPLVGVFWITFYQQTLGVKNGQSRKLIHCAPFHLNWPIHGFLNC